MTTIRVDLRRLEELARQLAALHREFEAAESRVDGYDEAAGHERLADRLRRLATNWSDVRPEVLAQLDALARLAGDAADFYREREAALSRGINQAVSGGD